MLTYFLVNSLAVAAAFALASRRPILRVWHDNFLWSITSYVIGGLVAGLTVELFQRAGHWQTSLAFVPLCLTYRTYKIYLGRIADEQRRVEEWTQLHRESTEVLARAIQAKDGSNTAHVERVQYYAGTLARHLHLSELDRQAVEMAALLHDVGKLAVPEHILSKPGPLTADERRKMQIHAQIGAEIVGAVPFPFPVAPLIRSHHERWDGTGYPSGLRGAQIPIGARILAVVDCFDAVTSERPYRRAVSQDDALRILRGGRRQRVRPGDRQGIHAAGADVESVAASTNRLASVGSRATTASTRRRPRLRVRPARTHSRKSRSPTGRATRSTRSPMRWDEASAWPKR